MNIQLKYLRVHAHIVHVHKCASHRPTNQPQEHQNRHVVGAERFTGFAGAHDITDEGWPVPRPLLLHNLDTGREGRREGGKGGREGGREGVREKGGKKGGREGGRKGEGREEGREGGRKSHVAFKQTLLDVESLQHCTM